MPYDDIYAVVVEETWIRRLPHGYPYWSPGRLPRPLGNLFFAGDWVEYPSTDAAVRSGQLATGVIRQRLDATPDARHNPR